MREKSCSHFSYRTSNYELQSTKYREELPFQECLRCEINDPTTSLFHHFTLSPFHYFTISLFHHFTHQSIRTSRSKQTDKQQKIRHTNDPVVIQIGRSIAAAAGKLTAQVVDSSRRIVVHCLWIHAARHITSDNIDCGRNSRRALCIGSG